jgi:hypothetical protein
MLNDLGDPEYCVLISRFQREVREVHQRQIRGCQGKQRDEGERF